MSGKLLLDTNAIIRLIGGEPGIRSLIAEAEEVFIPFAALGELFYGAYKSARVAENIARLKEFIRGRSILACDSAAAEQFGRIKAELKRKGRMIPENDIWIAAIGKHHGLVVLSADAHFEEVEGLHFLKSAP